MILIYSSLILLLSPLIGFCFLFSKRGRIGILERFGIWTNIDRQQNWIWFHAASLGEVNAIKKLAILTKDKLNKNNQKNYKLLVTVSSASAKSFALGFADCVKIQPFDSVFFYYIALGRLKIRTLIITETEVWPGLLYFTKLKDIPAYWVNARVMQKSFKFYSYLKFIFKPLLTRIQKIYAQTDTDAMRFREILDLKNLDNEKIEVLGNTKYDLNPIPLQLAQKTVNVSKSFPVVTICNIRPQEEDIIFPMLKKYQDKMLFLLAPRHSEKFEYFKIKLTQQGINFNGWQSFKDNNIEHGIVLVDKFGVLDMLVAQSDAVVAAGSFTNAYKGHNLLIGAGYQLPLCTGPYNSSSSPVLEELVSHDAVSICKDSNQLNSFIEQLIIKDPKLQESARNISKYIARHSNVTETVSTQLQEHISALHINKSKNCCTSLLRTLSIVFNFITSIRNLLFDNGIFKTYRSGLKVISVGNISVGGTGKTPLVIFLAKYLSNRNYRIGIVSRGYKGHEPGPLLIDSKNVHSLTSKQVGDEPLEIAKSTDCPVIIAKNRQKGVKLIEQQNLANIVILDDGLQHRWVRRDADIVCIDVSSKEAVNDFISGQLLPYGILRESLPKALERTSQIVFSTRSLFLNDQSIVLPEYAKVILPVIKNIPWVVSGYSNPKLVNISNGNRQEITGNFDRLSAYAFCGIANPQGFLKSLATLQVNIYDSTFFADHHDFNEQDILQIKKSVKEGSILITTQKDYMRLSEKDRQDVFYLEMDLRINDLSFLGKLL